MIYIGIDVGKKGAIAFLDDTGTAKVHSQPLIGNDLHEAQMAAMLNISDCGEWYALIERAHSMPHRNATNTCTLCRHFGVWQGLLMALAEWHNEGDYNIVDAKEWQKVMLVGHSPAACGTKAASVGAAMQLFPHVNLFRNSRCRVQSDGMSDALLIAEYGRRMHCGELLKQGE